MKRMLIIMVSALLIAADAMAQAKKPELMVVPGEIWCNKNGYVQKVDNQGMTETIPDYSAALSSDMDLLGAITKINALMADRGFPLKDLQQTMKNINRRSAENSLIMSRSTGASIAESPLDRLRRVAKADIILDLNWEIKTTGPKKTLHYILRGLDAYTGKQVAGSEGSGNPSFSAEVPVLLEEAIQDHMEAFCAQLMTHFEDMQQNGREIVVEVQTFDDGSGLCMESEYDGYELTEIIENWMAENTVQHRFSKADATENYIQFTQVRIPLYKQNGMAQDAEGFTRELSRFLKAAPYNIPSKIIQRGLGECLLILGEK